MNIPPRTSSGKGTKNTANGRIARTIKLGMLRDRLGVHSGDEVLKKLRRKEK
jgi:hypothetical protein